MKIAIPYLLLASTFLPAFAQEKPAPTFRLHFRFQESGTQAGNTSRDFLLLVQSNTLGKLNASRRLPFYSTTKGDAKEVHTEALGSIIECEPKEAEGGVHLTCVIESSYVDPEQSGTNVPFGFLPVMNSRQVHTALVAPLGSELQIAQMDDPASGNRLEIFVTADRLR